MDKDQVLRSVETAYESFLQEAFKTAVQNSLLGEENAEARFLWAAKIATETKNKITQAL